MNMIFEAAGKEVGLFRQPGIARKGGGFKQKGDKGGTYRGC
jgi:hypothetical protein